MNEETLKLFFNKCIQMDPFCPNGIGYVFGDKVLLSPSVYKEYQEFILKQAFKKKLDNNIESMLEEK